MQLLWLLAVAIKKFEVAYSCYGCKASAWEGERRGTPAAWACAVYLQLPQCLRVAAKPLAFVKVLPVQVCEKASLLLVALLQLPGACYSLEVLR